MKIAIELAPLLRRPAGQSRVELDVPAGTRASEAIAALGYDDLEQRALRLCRDDVMLAPGDRLHDGDQLLLFAAVGGG